METCFADGSSNSKSTLRKLFPVTTARRSTSGRVDGQRDEADAPASGAIERRQQEKTTFALKPAIKELDFATDWSGTVVVTRGHDRPQVPPRNSTLGLRVVQANAFRVAGARGPPNGQIKQSTIEFISEARNSCCTRAGASSAHTTSWRQAGSHHR